MSAELSEEELIKSAQGGNAESTDMLLRRYKSLVIKCAREYFITGAETDDLIQEGMLGLYKAIVSYDADNGARFISFAYTCIRSNILDAVRKAGREKHRPLSNYVSLTQEENGVDVFGAEGSNPEEIALKEEYISGLLEQAKSKLSKKENAVFDLYMNGLSMHEIAHSMSMDIKQVDNALQRIKKKVRKS